MWDVVIFSLVTGCLLVILGERLGAKQAIVVQVVAVVIWPLLLVILALFGKGVPRGKSKPTQ
jgi:hypothetical protein